MFNLMFLRATLERALKTFAQALGAMLTADGTGIVNSNWTESLSVAGMAAVLSVLTSVASGPLGHDDGPSLTGDEHLTLEGL